MRNYYDYKYHYMDDDYELKTKDGFIGRMDCIFYDFCMDHHIMFGNENHFNQVIQVMEKEHPDYDEEILSINIDEEIFRIHNNNFKIVNNETDKIITPYLYHSTTASKGEMAFKIIETFKRIASCEGCIYDESEDKYRKSPDKIDAIIDQYENKRRLFFPKLSIQFIHFFIDILNLRRCWRSF